MGGGTGGCESGSEGGEIDGGEDDGVESGAGIRECGGGDSEESCGATPSAATEREEVHGGQGRVANGGTLADVGAANVLPAPTERRGLQVPQHSLQAFSSSNSRLTFFSECVGYYELVIQLPLCESIKLPGYGSKITDYKYKFCAPDTYMPLELVWPTQVDAACMQSTFTKSKRILSVRVPMAGATV